MKIDKVGLYHLRMPLVSPFETSFGSIDHRECVLTTIFSDGLIGYGECTADRDPSYSYETSKSAWYILKEYLIPPLLGKKIPSPQAFQASATHVQGHMMAKAGLEMALWDLNGKRQNRSLRGVLGGMRDKVQVGVSVGLQESPQALVHTVERYLAQGYGRIKIKIKPGRDVKDTQAVRTMFPNLPLQVDANSAYTLESATSLHPLDELNLLLIEQPLYEDDLWYHRQLQAQFATPICLDESIISPRHARQALEMDACQIINIKQGRVGGLTNALAIHDLCQSQNIPVWCGGMLETGVGRAANLALASLPNFKLPGDISATDRYYQHDITNEIFSLNADSTISVPESPGLGVSLNSEMLERYTLNKLVL